MTTNSGLAMRMSREIAMCNVPANSLSNEGIFSPAWENSARSPPVVGSSPCAMQERIQHFPGQVRRVPACQAAIATATRRAHRLNDESLGHITQP